jgi:hypothetical protein
VRKLTAKRELVIVDAGEHGAPKRLASGDLDPIAQLDPLL